MALEFHSKEEEPLMMQTVAEINHLLLDAQSKGLSLPGALNVMAHAITMILVCSYRSRATREQVASSIPDMVKAYIPQWETIVANQPRGLSAGEGVDTPSRQP